MHSQNCDWILMFMFHFEKGIFAFSFLCFSSPFSKWNINIKIQLQSWLCTRLHAYYICYNDLCKPIEKYFSGSEKTPFTSYLTAKHPKHSYLAFMNIRDKPVNFWSSPAWSYISAHKTIACLGSFVKFSVPVQSSIPCSSCTQSELLVL